MDDQRQARDEAMAAVEARSAYWRPYALKAAYEAACLKREITSDDVWRILHERGVPDPGEPRAMGPVMVASQKSGWIEQTDRTKISDDPSTPNHSRPQRVYVSKVVGSVLPTWEKKPIDHTFMSFRSRVEYRQDLPEGGYSVEKIADLDDGGVVIGISDHRTPGMEGRNFPLTRKDDGTIEVVTSTCAECGGSYAVEADHRHTLRHREAVAKAQTIAGQTEIPVPVQPPIQKFTERPKGIGFGDVLICPGCKGTYRMAPKTAKRPSYRRDFTSTMHKPDDPCLRCNGIGIVPNQGPVA